MNTLTVKDLKTGTEYQIQVTASGENHMPCPVCSHERKKKNAKCFSYNVSKGVGHCSHCDATLVSQRQIENKADFKPYKRPKWHNSTQLSDRLIKWLQGRGIGQKTALKMRLGEGLAFLPQKGVEVNCIQFPYFFREEVINIKYRDGEKNFKLETGAQLIAYNLDSVLDANTVIVVEGEMDCLSMVEAGYTNTISVPNGANAGSMTWLDHCLEVLSPDVKWVLGLDNDPPGNNLKAELIRRLGAENCSTVVFKDCKDANECLVKYGIQGIIESMSEAKDVPLSGIFTSTDIIQDIEDYFNNGLPRGCKIGNPQVDDLISFHPGHMSVWTGIPGMGKSEIVDYVCCRLNVMHGWKTAFYSPENYPLQLHFSKIAEKLVGKTFDGRDKINEVELRQAIKYFASNFYFIKPEDDLSLDSILSHVKILVKKKGINIFVIDAWNKIEHMFTTNETQYISKELDKLTIFCEKNQVHLALVAHPTKMMKDKATGLYEVPNLYNISGSAAFYNKCSLGVSVHRDKDGLTELHVQKVKFKHWGKTGMVKLAWNFHNGRYSTPGEYFDDTNWINKSVQTSFDDLGDAPF